MNAKMFPIVLMLLLCLGAAQAANLSVNDIAVSITYPEPYDRFSDRVDLDSDIVDGGKIQADIYPGSLVEFTFDVENTYPSGSNDRVNDIDDIFATITVEELDDGEDVEEESDDFDLEAGNDGRVRIVIPIPTKVEAKEYNVKIVVEGEGNISTQRIELNLKMDVFKESHDLKLISYSVIPEQVSCDRSIVVKAAMANLGRNEEPDAGIDVRSDGLGLVKEKKDIVLSEDPFNEESEYTFTVPFTISNSIKAGNYSIDIRALFKGEVQMDKRTLHVLIKDCGAAVPAQEENPVELNPQVPKQSTKNESEESQPILTPPKETAAQPVVNKSGEEQVSSSVEKPFLKTGYGRAALIGGNVILLIVLIYFGAKMVAKSAKKRNDGNQEKEE